MHDEEQSPEALLHKALARQEAGETAEALQHLNLLLRSHPHHAMGLLWRGFLRVKVLDVEGALGDWELAVETDPALVRASEGPELKPSVENALQQLKFAATVDPTDARFQLYLGRAYAVFGRYALALQAFASAQRLAPELWEAGDGCAMVYQKLGQLDQAVAAMARLVEAHPNSAPLNYRLGTLYLQANSSAQAVRFLERAATLDPGDLRSALALAEILLRQGRQEQAMSRFEKVLAQDSQSSPALVGLAECCKELYRFEEALTYYQRALEISPEDFKTLTAMGSLCIQLGGLDLGIDALLRALELNPDDVDTYSSLARAFQQKGDLATAADYYTQTVQMNPRDYFAAYNLGLIYRSQGNLAEAARLFSQAAALRPNDSQYQFNLARALLELGKVAEGLEAAQRAVTLNPHGKELQLLYGRACLEAGKYAEAVEAFHHAATIDPQSTDAHYQAAITFLHLGRYDDAKKSFQNVLRLAPNHAPSLHGMGHVYRKTGAPGLAVDLFTQAIVSDPSQKHSVHELARLCLEPGHTEAATESLETILDTHPEDPRIAGAYLEAWLEVMAPAGEYDLGTHIVEHILANFPGHEQGLRTQARWHMGWARRLAEAGEVARARLSLDRLLEAQPGHPEALQLMGMLEGGSTLAAPEPPVVVDPALEELADAWLEPEAPSAEPDPAETDSLEEPGPGVEAPADAWAESAESAWEQPAGAWGEPSVVAEEPPPAAGPPDPWAETAASDEPSPWTSSNWPPANEDWDAPASDTPAAPSMPLGTPLGAPRAPEPRYRDVLPGVGPRESKAAPRSAEPVEAVATTTPPVTAEHIARLLELPGPTYNPSVERELLKSYLDFAFLLETGGWFREAATTLSEVLLRDPQLEEARVQLIKVLPRWAKSLQLAQDQAGARLVLEALLDIDPAHAQGRAELDRLGGAPPLPKAAPVAPAPPVLPVAPAPPVAPVPPILKSARPVPISPPPAAVTPSAPSAEDSRHAPLDPRRRSSLEPPPPLAPPPAGAPAADAEPAGAAWESSGSWEPQPPGAWDSAETPAPVTPVVQPAPAPEVPAAAPVPAPAAPEVTVWDSAEVPAAHTAASGESLETPPAVPPEPEVTPPEPEPAETEVEEEYDDDDEEYDEEGPSWTPVDGSESLEELITLTTKEPDNTAARQAIYAHLGDDAPRLVQVYRALATDYGEEDPYHVLNLARAYVHTGSDSLAVLQLRKYVKNEPTAEGYRELGDVYERMGKGELAQQAFKKAGQYG